MTVIFVKTQLSQLFVPVFLLSKLFLMNNKMHDTDKAHRAPCIRFSCINTLQPRDINYGGYLGNDALVSLMGTARAQMLRSMGKSESDLGDGKTSIIMTDFVINFKAEAFMFDELTVDTHIGDLSKTSFRIIYQVMRGRVIIALAETGLAAFDTITREKLILSLRCSLRR